MKKIKKIEEIIIKDIQNFFRLRKEIDDTTIKNLRNLFRLKKEIDDTTVKDIRNLFILEKEKQSKMEPLEILGIFLSMKEKIIINKYK